MTDSLGSLSFEEMLHTSKLLGYESVEIATDWN